MVTKYDTGDKIWVMATVKSAEKVKDKIYYTINESKYVVPEEICRKCSEEEISALREARQQYTVFDALSYSSRDSLFPAV